MRTINSVLANIDTRLESGIRTLASKLDTKTELAAGEVLQIHSAMVQARQMLDQVRQPLGELFNAVTDGIRSTLDGKPGRAYTFAVNTWTSSHLETYDPVVREHIKEVLRDYFAPSGRSFAAWEPNA